MDTGGVERRGCFVVFKFMLTLFGGFVGIWLLVLLWLAVEALHLLQYLSFIWRWSCNEWYFGIFGIVWP